MLEARRRRGCGKVGIPRLLRDFQAEWESWLFDVSTPRFLHSPGALRFVVCQGRALGAVSAQPVRSVGEAESSVQLLMHSDAAPRQAAAPSHRFDLQTEILEADRVVPMHRAFELQRQDQIQIPAATLHKRVTRLRGPHLKTAVELSYVVLSQKNVRRVQSPDPSQPQLLRSRFERTRATTAAQFDLMAFLTGLYFSEYYCPTNPHANMSHLFKPALVPDGMTPSVPSMSLAKKNTVRSCDGAPMPNCA